MVVCYIVISIVLIEKQQSVRFGECWFALHPVLVKRFSMVQRPSISTTASQRKVKIYFINPAF
ncbi:MAG: hypothetical protein WBP54_01125 [Pelodictyon phaeoclathratiforme]